MHCGMQSGKVNFPAQALANFVFTNLEIAMKLQEQTKKIGRKKI